MLREGDGQFRKSPFEWGVVQWKKLAANCV